MRYWGILAAKLVVATIVLYGIWIGLHLWYPVPPQYILLRQEVFLHDLPWTTIVFVFCILVQGVFTFIIQDQRSRCRTCGRRLRMPVSSGSHAHVLFGPPRTDYICLYGHGTLKVPELHLTGRQEPKWKANDDIWTELYETSAKAKSGKDLDE